MFEIMKYSKSNNLKVVEDACMGTGASLKENQLVVLDIFRFGLHPKTLNVLVMEVL